MGYHHLYTIAWSQPYATDHVRPYLRYQMAENERLIEKQLEDGDFALAKQLIERIKNNENSR
jgi:hypothetical protein